MCKMDTVEHCRAETMSDRRFRAKQKALRALRIRIQCEPAVSVIFSLFSSDQTVEVPQKISTTVVEQGGNVTLECPASSLGSNVYIWYKMTLGNMPQTVATVKYDQTTITEPNEQRFTVAKEKDHYVLTIQNVNKDDEGTYLCKSGTSHSPTFTNGTFVTIKEARVHCPGEHNVYWIKAGSGESHPTIYTHVRNGDKPEEKNCVYNLSRSRDCSGSGTCYCAVVSCGEILSGEETTEDTSTKSGSKLDPVVLVLGTLLFCCVIVIVVLSYFIKRQKRDRHEAEMSASLPPGRHRTTVDQPSDLDNDAAALNYAALNFTKRKLKTEEKKRKLPEECVYSVVKADYHNKQHPSLDQDL
ncbi:uncharacterized protein V6R79_022859 [Siganus canaliculatus]